MRLGLAGVFLNQCADPGQLPPDLLESLRRRRLMQAAREIRLLGAEQHAMGVLQQAGLRVVAIKGLDLLRTLKIPDGERNTQDVDLLVPPEALRPALEALGAVGYTPVNRYAATAAPEYFHDVALRAPREKVVVEIHHHFFDRHALRHTGEDPAGRFMPWFWQNGIEGEALTAFGRWLVVALRWTRDGYARNHTLRDLVHVTALLPVREQVLVQKQMLSDFGLWPNLDLALKVADFFISETPPVLTTEQTKILRLTRPTLAKPQAPFGKKLLWLTRPAGARAALLSRALWPTTAQLAFSLHEPAPSGLGRVGAVCAGMPAP